MHQLLILRHAKSSWDDPKLDDRDRPLAPRGRRAANAMRRAMAEWGLAPDLVLVSPARRAMQTLEALEPWDETPLTDQVEALYLATPTQMMGLLHNVAETVRSVLLIGHNPGLHEFAVTLLGAQSSEAARQLVEKYPTCALAEFMIPGPWLHLGPGGAQLMRFVTPRAIA